MKLKKSEFVALLIVVMLNSELLYAQPDMLWSITFGGENGDGGYSVVQTADGGYAIAGHTRSFGESDEYGNGWLIKTDENGEELWSQTYGGELGGGFLSMVQIDDGFVMAGYIFLEENDFDSFWVVRTDSEGEVIWSNTYGDAGQCLSIIQTNDGGFATVCVDYDLRNSNVSTTRLIKISGDGDQEWDRNHLEDFDAYNWCNSIVQTEDGGYALGGYLELIDSKMPISGLLKPMKVGERFGQQPLMEEGMIFVIL